MICQEGSQCLKLTPEAFIDLDMQLISSDEEFFEELCTELKIEYCRGRKLQRKLRERNYIHHILCLDEIEKMTYKEKFTQEARAGLRGLADGMDTPLTLVIASRSGLDRLFPESSDQTSPLYNLCRRIEVKCFTSEDARDFLLHRLGGTGIQFSESQIEELWTRTQGHPAKLQAAAQELYARLSL